MSHYDGTDTGIIVGFTLPNDGDVRKADSVNIAFEPIADSLFSIANGHWTMTGIQTVDAGGQISLKHSSQIILASSSSILVGSGCALDVFAAQVNLAGATVTLDAPTTVADAATTTLTGHFHVGNGSGSGGGVLDVTDGGLAFIRSGGFLTVEDGGIVNVAGSLQTQGADGIIQASTDGTIRIDNGGTFHVDGGGAAQMNGDTTFVGGFGGSVVFSDAMPVTFTTGSIVSFTSTAQVDYSDTPITGSRNEQGRVQRTGSGAYVSERVGRIAPTSQSIDAHAYDKIGFNAGITTNFTITLNDVPHGYAHPVRFWLENAAGLGIGANIITWRDSLGNVIQSITGAFTVFNIDMTYDPAFVPRWSRTSAVVTP